MGCNGVCKLIASRCKHSTTTGNADGYTKATCSCMYSEVLKLLGGSYTESVCMYSVSCCSETTLNQSLSFCSSGDDGHVDEKGEDDVGYVMSTL